MIYLYIRIYIYISITLAIPTFLESIVSGRPNGETWATWWQCELSSNFGTGSWCRCDGEICCSPETDGKNPGQKSGNIDVFFGKIWEQKGNIWENVVIEMA